MADNQRQPAPNSHSIKRKNEFKNLSIVDNGNYPKMSDLEEDERICTKSSKEASDQLGQRMEKAH